MDGRKSVFIAFSLLKVLSPAATVISIVNIILIHYEICRFGKTFSSLLVLMSLAVSIGSLTLSGYNFLAIYSLEQRSQLSISLFSLYFDSFSTPWHATLSSFFSRKSFRSFKNPNMPLHLFNCSNISEKELIELSNITLKTCFIKYFSGLDAFEISSVDSHSKSLFFYELFCF